MPYWKVELGFPFPPPYSPEYYPVISQYDYTDSDPAHWHLKLGVERLAGDGVPVLAVCDGMVSTVPLDQLPPESLGLVQLPDGSLPTSPTRLYLTPHSTVLADTRLRDALAASGLGTTIRWFVYENVDPVAIQGAISTAVEGDPRVSPSHPLHVDLDNQTLTPEGLLEAFLEGQVGEPVRLGDVIGIGSRAGASSPEYARAAFGVQTTIGYIDPYAFYDVVQSLLTPDAEAERTDFFSLFMPSTWPVREPQGDAASVVSAAQARLYPLPALADARTRAGLDDGQWRQVRDAQKAMYWRQLLVRSGHAPAAFTDPPFTFNTDDMANPFQLEAVTEFFLNWKSPAIAGTTPAQTVPVPARADFLKDRLTLYVQVEGGSAPSRSTIGGTSSWSTRSTMPCSASPSCRRRRLPSHPTSSKASSALRASAQQVPIRRIDTTRCSSWFTRARSWPGFPGPPIRAICGRIRNHDDTRMMPTVIYSLMKIA